MYINPTRTRGYEVESSMWVRVSELAGGLGKDLYTTVRRWIESMRSLSEPAHPEREFPMEEWHTLPEA